MSSASNQRALLCLSAAGFHRIAYRDWGPPGATRLVVAVHGLTRNSRDFDELAAALAAADLRVICPDIVGRGDSDPLNGTGCTLAAAVTASLAKGEALQWAVETAKNHVGRTLRESYALQGPDGQTVHCLNQGTSPSENDA